MRVFNNQKCMTQPTLINLHPNEYGQEFHYNSFLVKFDISVWSCNVLNDYRNKWIKNIDKAYIMWMEM